MTATAGPQMVQPYAPAAAVRAGSPTAALNGLGCGGTSRPHEHNAASPRLARPGIVSVPQVSPHVSPVSSCYGSAVAAAGHGYPVTAAAAPRASLQSPTAGSVMHPWRPLSPQPQPQQHKQQQSTQPTVLQTGLVQGARARHSPSPPTRTVSGASSMHAPAGSVLLSPAVTAASSPGRPVTLSQGAGSGIIPTGAQLGGRRALSTGRPQSSGRVTYGVTVAQMAQPVASHSCAATQASPRLQPARGPLSPTRAKSPPFLAQPRPGPSRHHSGSGDAGGGGSLGSDGAASQQAVAAAQAAAAAAVAAVTGGPPSQAGSVKAWAWRGTPGGSPVSNQSPTPVPKAVQAPNFGSASTPAAQAQAPASQTQASATASLSAGQSHTQPQASLSTPSPAIASTASTSSLPATRPAPQAFVRAPGGGIGRVHVLPRHLPERCSSATSQTSMIVVPPGAAADVGHIANVVCSEQDATFSRLQELLANTDTITAGLRSNVSLIASDGERKNGLVSLDTAANVLHRTLDSHLTDLPSTRIDKERWLSLLKRFGVYRVGGVISFEHLCKLYIQTLTTLRDCVASKDFLRSMRRVPRNGCKLKDRYDSFEFRAKDSLGKTYHCRDSQSKELRACRQIRKDKSSMPVDIIRNSLTEMQEMQCPYMPRVIEYLEDFHNFYVVTDRVESNDVLDYVQDAYVRTGCLTETWVASVIHKVLEATHYCHQWGKGPLMHRDLGHSCVLVSPGPLHADDHPQVSVAGFGLNSLFDLSVVGHLLPAGCMSPPPPGIGGLPEPMPSCSMPEFLAPEVWQRDYGPRCDIWAIGCLMFLLLTGAAPFGPGLPLRDLAHSICNSEPDWRFFRGASTSALALCRRMLCKDDASRPTAAECLRHPWIASLGSGGDHPPKELRTETFSTLMQFHAQAKFHQVLINVVAAELKVGRLARVRTVLERLDTSGGGALEPEELERGFEELGVSPQNAEQTIRVLRAFGEERPGREVAYGMFVASCIDLVDDKLDHMLWKVFALVDEDHSGEISTVVLEHFLSAACNGDGDNAAGDNGDNAGGGGTSDVERYLRSVLDSEFAVHSAMADLSAGREYVTFEDIKHFLLNGGGSMTQEEVMQRKEEDGLASSARIVDSHPDLQRGSC